MKLNKRFSAILTGTYISFLIPCVSGQAGPGQMGEHIDQPDRLNIIPTTPQAASLGSFTHQGINGATGTPVITIPIYTLVEDGVEVPIFLSYDATGIRLEDIATEVGLKWSLYAGGSVSRVIRGLADDEANNGWINYKGGYFPQQNWNTDPDCHQAGMDLVASNNIDAFPDLFTYSIGGSSGTFFFDRGGSPWKTISGDIKINANTTTVQGANKRITGFELIDGTGTKYLFGDGRDWEARTEKETGLSRGGAASTTKNEPRSGNGVVEWKLKKITTRNNKVINFSYTAYTIEYTMQNNEIRKLVATGSNFGANDKYETDCKIETRLPSRIESDNIRIDFSYSAEGAAYVWQRKLTGITITDKATDNKKSFTLGYGLYPGCAKLRLDKVTEIDNGIADLGGEKWEFKYIGGNLPDMNHKDFDFFGYYNAAGNQHFIPFDIPGSGSNATPLPHYRNVNAAALRTGILDEIKYPTGGRSKFYYEPNTEKNANNIERFAPGVRVSRIDEFENNNNNSLLISTRYNYSGLEGNIHAKGQIRGFYSRPHSDGSAILYTFPWETQGRISGHCYRTVTIEYLENNVVKYREVETYHPYQRNNAMYPKLIKKEYFDDTNNPVRKTEYKYERIITTIPGYNPASDDVKVDEWYVDVDYVSGGQYYYCSSTTFLKEGTFFYPRVHKVTNSAHWALKATEILNTEYYGTGNISEKHVFEYITDPYTLQLAEHRLYISEEDDVYYETKYTYPNIDNYKPLYDKRIWGLPLTKTVSYGYTDLIYYPPFFHAIPNTVITDKKRYDYDANGNLTRLYDFVDDASSGYVYLKEEYSYYTSTGVPSGLGKVREVRHLDGTYTTYLWGYRRQFPIAEIKNARYSEVCRAIGNGNETTGNNTLEDIAKKNVPLPADYNNINGLRTRLPSAMVTTYEYKPLSGISKITDSKGITTYYEYDALGRLTVIKTEEVRQTPGDIKKVKSFEYNYRQ
jgi:YD repeat-containing protein